MSLPEFGIIEWVVIGGAVPLAIIGLIVFWFTQRDSGGGVVVDNKRLGKGGELPPPPPPTDLMRVLYLFDGEWYRGLARRARIAPFLSTEAVRLPSVQAQARVIFRWVVIGGPALVLFVAALTFNVWIWVGFLSLPVGLVMGWIAWRIWNAQTTRYGSTVICIYWHDYTKEELTARKAAATKAQAAHDPKKKRKPTDEAPRLERPNLRQGEWRPLPRHYPLTVYLREALERELRRELADEDEEYLQERIQILRRHVDSSWYGPEGLYRVLAMKAEQEALQIRYNANKDDEKLNVWVKMAAIGMFGTILAFACDRQEIVQQAANVPTY